MARLTRCWRRTAVPGSAASASTLRARQQRACQDAAAGSPAIRTGKTEAAAEAPGIPESVQRDGHAAAGGRRVPGPDTLPVFREQAEAPLGDVAAAEGVRDPGGEPVCVDEGDLIIDLAADLPDVIIGTGE